MRSFLMPYGTVGRIKRSGNHCETWAVRPDVPRNSRHPPVDIPGGADLKRLVFRLIGFNSISPRSGDLKLGGESRGKVAFQGDEFEEVGAREKPQQHAISNNGALLHF